MAIHINFVCENPNCHVVHSWGFEELHETWGEMLKVATQYGWCVKDPLPTTAAKTLCPSCNPNSPTYDAEHATGNKE